MQENADRSAIHTPHRFRLSHTKHGIPAFLERHINNPTASDILKASVSIIMPVYNAESYLRECLDSVVNQTLREIEIICVNDGSTDSSLAILKEYASRDSRIVVISGSNGGYGKAMNTGMDHATGDYIGIVEPDDLVTPDMFESLYKITLAHPGIDMVRGDHNQFWGEGKNRILFPILQTGHAYYYNRVIDIREDIFPFARFPLNTWAGIYRRAFLVENNIRHHETPGASFQDNGFFFQCFSLATTVYYLNKAYYWYRYDNPNSSINTDAKLKAFPREHAFILDFINKHPEHKPRVMPVLLLRSFMNYVFCFDTLAEHLKHRALETARNEWQQYMERGELDTSLFSPEELIQFTVIMKAPNKFSYYRKRPGVPYLSFWQKIFSITERKRHHQINLLGIHIKIRK